MMESLIMLEQNKPINYISDKLGYNSESAFINCFKQWMGTTPYAYKGSINCHLIKLFESLTSAKQLLSSGMLPKDVAQNLGVSIPTLYRWLPASNNLT